MGQLFICWMFDRCNKIWWFCNGGYHGGKNGPQLRLDIDHPSGPFNQLYGIIPHLGSSGGEYGGLLLLLPLGTIIICGNYIINN